MRSNRDITLDLYRGFAFFWVLVVHSIFWLNFLGVGSFSWLLFEMPILFWIIGVVNFKTRKKYWQFLIGRIKRIIIPYWFYAFFCILIILIFGSLSDNVSVARWSAWIIPIIVPENGNISFLTWHLWFIPIYIIICFFLPIFAAMYKKLSGFKKFLPLIVLFLLVAILKPDSLNYYPNIKNIISYLSFYVFWIYLGFFHEGGILQTNKIKIFFPASIISLMVIIISINNGLFSSNMQINKFPPNLAFMLFSIFTFSVFYLVKEKMILLIERLKLKNFFLFFSKNSLIIYIYHPFAFLLLFSFLKKTNSIRFFLINPEIGVILFLLFAILMSKPIVWLFQLTDLDRKKQ